MNKKTLKNKSLLHFGASLKKARISAGYNSLSASIAEIRKKFPASAFSKATLNFIENGTIADLNTNFLKVLCDLYSLNYEQKLREYLSIRYSLPGTFFNGKFVKNSDSETLLIGDASDPNSIVEIISLGKFKKLQGEVSPNSIIWVSVINFIDDDTFFEVVLSNIKRGVRYYYYVPEESEVKYRQFISMLSKELKLPASKIDNKKCFFIKRGLSEYPIVSVLFINPEGSPEGSPEGTIEGFVGLACSDKVSYLQRADILLSWRLYQSFLMALSMTLDDDIHERRKAINSDLKNITEIKGFPVLMGSLGV